MKRSLFALNQLECVQAVGAGRASSWFVVIVCIDADVFPDSRARWKGMHIGADHTGAGHGPGGHGCRH